MVRKVLMLRKGLGASGSVPADGAAQLFIHLGYGDQMFGSARRSNGGVLCIDELRLFFIFLQATPAIQVQTGGWRSDDPSRGRVHFRPAGPLSWVQGLVSGDKWHVASSRAKIWATSCGRHSVPGGFCYLYVEAVNVEQIKLFRQPVLIWATRYDRCAWSENNTMTKERDVMWAT